MLLKSTVEMTCPRAWIRIFWRLRSKGVTPEPMIRSTEYSAVASVLVALLASVFMTVTEDGLTTGLGALVAAGTVATGTAALVARGTAAFVASGTAAVVASGTAAVVASGTAAVVASGTGALTATGADWTVATAGVVVDSVLKSAVAQGSRSCHGQIAVKTESGDNKKQQVLHFMTHR